MKKNIFINLKSVFVLFFAIIIIIGINVNWKKEANAQVTPSTIRCKKPYDTHCTKNTDGTYIEGHATEV
ncbi:MAG: hypothetical protein AB7S50_06175 [Bacteroidales bacterium]